MTQPAKDDLVEQAATNTDAKRPCTCYPGEGPIPCPQKHALWDCQHEAVLRGTHKIVEATRITELEAQLAEARAENQKAWRERNVAVAVQPMKKPRD